MAPKQESIRFDYKKREGLVPHLVHGAYGGVTSKGLIEMDFYFECLPLPIYHRIEIKGKRLGAELEKKMPDEGAIERNIVAGVSMDLNTAKSVLKWLTEKIQSLEKMQEEFKE